MTPVKQKPAARFEKINMPPDTFRELGHALVEQIAGLFERLPTAPVTTAAQDETIRAMLQALSPASDNGQDAGALLEKTTRLLFDHSLFNGHPKFWGYITSSPTPMGILADMLAAAVNPNVGAYVLSPVATEIEKQTIDWIGRFMGYPAGGGLLVSGGNMANYVGFLAALRAATGADIRKSGLRNFTPNLVLYCSAETHTWVQKAADLYGLGTDSIRWIGTDAQKRMSPVLLEEKILADKTAGNRPFLVVGTAGSVSTGAVDPLDALAALCEKYGVWFHIDGAYGGFAGALPELKTQFAGLEKADSLAVDPHKWLYAPLEAGCALVKNPRHLTDAFSYHPLYYNFEQTRLNFVDYGPQNSRGFRALKVWLSAQHLGMEGHRQLIREDIALARYAADILRAETDLAVFSSGLSITTFRYVPPDLSAHVGEPETEARLNQLNQAILNQMEAGGAFFMSNAVLDGVFVLRMCIVNFRTQAAHIEAIPEYIRMIGADLYAKMLE
ncbi:MAG: pyridoxal-dependent decarboxylase [Saprospiraceae bacterium]